MSRSLAPELSLGEIVDSLGGELHGDRSFTVSGLGSLRRSGPEQIAFLARPAEREAATQSRAGAFIVSPALAGHVPASAPRIVDGDPYGY